ncbi:MAG: ribose-phosphate pyrophosphokinase [Myxococcota bacterium]|jgi:ribose-phosphate pyrophosphokinase|nr:ribose-phosphate pyrophosphokinase [Myxococcota bacterium]
MAFQTISLFSGGANLPLAQAISRAASIKLGTLTIKRFSDGEVFVQIEENVRGSDAFVIQPTCPPVNDNLIELLVIIDALKRASVESITAVVPYYGYARQDRKVSPRTPISAKLVADLLQAAGVHRVVAVDLHAGQIQGFFDVPFDNLYGLSVLTSHLRSRVSGEVTVVSPDAGGTERARSFARRLHAKLAIIDKRRPKANESAVMHIIGEVAGTECIIVDDMVDTAGTLTNCAKALVDAGAKKVFAAATHGVLSGPAIDRLAESPIEEFVVTDTIPVDQEKRTRGRITVVTCAPLLAEAIKRIHTGDSVSGLFQEE